MKTQKTLHLVKNTAGGHISLLVRKIKERKKIEQEIVAHEEIIAKKISLFFKSSTNYDSFAKLLSLQVEKEVTGIKKIPTTTLLDQVSLQVVTSLSKYYDTAEDYPAGFINWGFESYFISYEEWLTCFESLKVEFIKEKIGELSNFFMEKYDIRFRVVQCDCKVDKDMFIKIFVEIFS